MSVLMSIILFVHDKNPFASTHLAHTNAFVRMDLEKLLDQILVLTLMSVQKILPFVVPILVVTTHMVLTSADVNMDLKCLLMVKFARTLMNVNLVFVYVLEYVKMFLVHIPADVQLDSV